MRKYTFSSGANDLTPLFCGVEACKSEHRFGPYVRDCFLIHFCFSGKGTLWDKHGKHKIAAGELFVIRPGEVTVYEADKTDPWTYGWVGFIGSSAQPFFAAGSVFPCPEEMKERVEEAFRPERPQKERFLAVLYELISRLFDPEKEETEDKISSIRRFVRYNYMREIRVEALAKEAGFERSYLYRMFKQRYGVGIKEYLTSVRLNQAKTFLLKGHSVSDTAHMVGYEDEFNFSKTYKKYFGYPPKKEGKQA